MEDVELYFAQKERRRYNTAFIFSTFFFHAISCPRSFQIHVKGGSSRKHLGLAYIPTKTWVRNSWCDEQIIWSWIKSEVWGGIKKQWIGRREWLVRACSKMEWKIQVTNVCLQGATEGRGTGRALNSSCNVFRSQSEILARTRPSQENK